MISPTLQRIVDALAACPLVEGIGVVGSRATGRASADADIDIMVFTTGPVPLELRRDLATQSDPDPEIANMWWGEGDYWQSEDGWIDLMFFDCAWFEDQLRSVLDSHTPSLGYTTAFWASAQAMQVLFDRSGRMRSIKDLADRPYPDELRTAIIAFNLPVLRDVHTSYRAQIEKALERGDLVAVQHRTTALLASVFDILFAWARLPHPGEKRQSAILAAHVPDELLHAIDAVAIARDNHLEIIDQMVNALEVLIASEPSSPR